MLIYIQIEGALMHLNYNYNYFNNIDGNKQNRSPLPVQKQYTPASVIPKFTPDKTIIFGAKQPVK